MLETRSFSFVLYRLFALVFFPSFSKFYLLLFSGSFCFLSLLAFSSPLLFIPVSQFISLSFSALLFSFPLFYSPRSLSPVRRSFLVISSLVLIPVPPPGSRSLFPFHIPFLFFSFLILVLPPCSPFLSVPTLSMPVQTLPTFSSPFFLLVSLPLFILPRSPSFVSVTPKTSRLTCVALANGDHPAIQTTIQCAHPEIRHL